MNMNENLRKVQEQTEVTEHGTIVIDGTDGIHHFQMVTAITELAFRVNTGGRISRANLVQFCAQMYGTKGKTHKKVLTEMVKHYEDTYGRSITDNKVVSRALGLKTEEA
jgi:hypothetical protein